MEIKIFKEVDELMIALADFIKKISEEAIARKGRFDFVLSGGSSPKKLYELLALKYREKIDWNRTYFFFEDERFVSADSVKRNSLMVKKALLDPLEIPKTNIFIVDTTNSPEDSAKSYMKNIEKHFDDQPIHFDFVLLGLGDNSHTASLFPFTSVLHEKDANIKSVFVKELDAYRITMTAPLINNAKHIAFLVFGENKADAVYNVLENKGSEEEYPAKLILSEEQNWFLDEEAAAKLSDNNS